MLSDSSKMSIADNLCKLRIKYPASIIADKRTIENAFNCYDILRNKHLFCKHVMFENESICLMKALLY